MCRTKKNCTLYVTLAKSNASAHIVYPIFVIHFIAAKLFVLLIVILLTFCVCRSVERDRAFRTNLAILFLSFQRT